MDLILSLGIFIVGIIVGFLASRFIPAFKSNKAELTAELEQSQQAQVSLKQELTDYIQSVQTTFQQVAEQAEKAAQAAHEYNAKVSASDTIEDDLIPYFGTETSAQLHQTERKVPLSKSLEKTDKESAPKDYSEGSSGLLEAESVK